MLSKVFKLSLFCLITSLVCANNVSQNSIIQIKPKISLETAICFLDSVDVIALLEKMPPKLSKKLRLCCSECKIHELNCASLAGYFASAQDAAKLKVLKELVITGDKKKIMSFLMEESNQNKVFCPICEKYVGWVEVTQSVSKTTKRLPRHS